MKSLKLCGILLATSMSCTCVAKAGDSLVMQSPRQVNTPNEIANSIPDKIIKAEAVDFNGDGKQDYLVIVEDKSDAKPLTYELWYTSSFKLVKRVPKYESDYDRKWFINLDDDPEPEIVSASGFEDGIDYSIYDQNLVKGTDVLLFRFNPVLIDTSNTQKEYYWGYPWDVTNIMVKAEGGSVRIRCSLNHDIERYGAIDIPTWQKKLPAIFFVGKTTQPDIEVGTIRNIEWLTLGEIEKQIR